jgi:hypothetical protein
MYITQIIHFLTLPAIIAISYWWARVNLRKLEKKLAEDGELD